MKVHQVHQLSAHPRPLPLASPLATLGSPLATLGWRQPPTTQSRYLLCTQQAQVDGFLGRISNERPPFLAVDTEFSRGRDLELLQVAFPNGDTYLLDPRRTQVNLSEFGWVLSDPSIVKVIHAARMDLIVLRRYFGRYVVNYLDTQVLAGECGLYSPKGYHNPIGYADLVWLTLGIRLDKTNQTSDWSRPVLTQEQLDYAALDVIHLVGVYFHLLTYLPVRAPPSRWR